MLCFLKFYIILKNKRERKSYHKSKRHNYSFYPNMIHTFKKTIYWISWCKFTQPIRFKTFHFKPRNFSVELYWMQDIMLIDVLRAHFMVQFMFPTFGLNGVRFLNDICGYENFLNETSSNFNFK